MSAVGSMTSMGQTFKAVVTNATESELASYMTKKTKVDVANAMIFSIPQNNGVDIATHGSIWLTDSEGQLYQMTKSINSMLVGMQGDIEEAAYKVLIGLQGEIRRSY